MSTENQIHDVAVEEEEERRPLIIHDFDPSILILHENQQDTIFPLPSDNNNNNNNADKSSLPSSLSLPNQRLVSLDVFRGLTVAVRPLFSTISEFNSTVSRLLIS